MITQAQNSHREINQLVADRCSFFANRVDTYASTLGLNSKQIVEHLLTLALVYGESAITGIIDQVVPAHLHSSQMPQ
jgi:zinc transporter ZupT